MNFSKINKTDIANGPGVRVSLFVSGCRNHCKGCFNEETWDFDYGKEFDRKALYEVITALKQDYIEGFSLLGGDPMEPENVAEATLLCGTIKVITHKTIWVYTGYFYEDIKDLPIMNYIDVLVDGPFVEELKDISLPFKGSTNQRIIDVQESLKAGFVVLKE